MSITIKSTKIGKNLFIAYAKDYEMLTLLWMIFGGYSIRAIFKRLRKNREPHPQQADIL